MPDRHVPRSKNSRTGVLAMLLCIAAAAVAATWFWLPRSVAPPALTMEDIEAWIRSLGAWGMLGSVVLMIAHSFLPFPAEVIALANGMVYGPMVGGVLTWVGAMLGAATAFGLVRKLGAPALIRLLSPRRQRQLDQWSHDRGALALLLLRLMPVVAFNLVNFGAALTRVSWWTFVWTTGVGILPMIILLVVAGDRIMQEPNWVWWLLVPAVLIWFVFGRRACAAPPDAAQQAKAGMAEPGPPE